jgi:hypothetical protein
VTNIEVINIGDVNDDLMQQQVRRAVLLSRCTPAEGRLK